MLQKYTDKILTAAIRQYVLVISPANPFLKFERVSGGVSPQEDLHSDEPGVGWEATGGLDIPGCHRVRRGDVCVELLGAHGCRPAAEGHQRRGLQSGFGGSLSGDVSQRPQEGERLSCRLTSSSSLFLCLHSSCPPLVFRVTCGKRDMCGGTGLSAGSC